MYQGALDWGGGVPGYIAHQKLGRNSDSTKRQYRNIFQGFSALVVFEGVTTILDVIHLKIKAEVPAPSSKSHPYTPERLTPNHGH